MAVQPYDHVERQYRRTEEIGDQALAAPAGEKVGLKALTPEMKAAKQDFDGAQAGVRAAARVAFQEKDESETATGALRGVYSEILPMAALKVGFAGKAPTEYATDDDFFSEVEQLEMALQAHASEPWAGAPLAQVTAAADAAAKEYAESVEARRALQKAQAHRAEVVSQTRPVFVAFRRCVRATFGTSSKEYRDLLDKQYQGNPTPAEPTPGA